MCGINGLLRLSGTAPPIDRDEVIRTRDAMTPRGPDGCGAWFSDDGRVALASRRLAILDLSEAGAQPMASEDGRFVIVLNGEIYNFAELGRMLDVRLRSRSDTEVVLALYAQEGPAMLSRLRGMYGLAIWDNLEKTLLLARDPLGIKPLYLSTEGGVLRFASQVKALEAGGAISMETDPAGVAGFPSGDRCRSRSRSARPCGRCRRGRTSWSGTGGSASPCPTLPPGSSLWDPRRRWRTRCGRIWSRMCRWRCSSPPGWTPG
jgi:asparagine synthase (glutamine-hydrolysing)